MRRHLRAEHGIKTRKEVFFCDDTNGKCQKCAFKTFSEVEMDRHIAQGIHEDKTEMYQRIVDKHEGVKRGQAQQGHVGRVDYRVRAQKGHVDHSSKRVHTQQGHVGRDDNRFHAQQGHVGRDDYRVHAQQGHVGRDDNRVHAQQGHVGRDDNRVQAQQDNAIQDVNRVQAQHGHVDQEAWPIYNVRRHQMPDGTFRNYAQLANQDRGHYYDPQQFPPYQNQPTPFPHYGNDAQAPQDQFIQWHQPQYQEPQVREPQPQYQVPQVQNPQDQVPEVQFVFESNVQIINQEAQNNPRDTPIIEAPKPKRRRIANDDDAVEATQHQGAQNDYKDMPIIEPPQEAQNDSDITEESSISDAINDLLSNTDPALFNSEFNVASIERMLGVSSANSTPDRGYVSN